MAGTVQVITENENPRGFVRVQAVAEDSKLGDGRPVAGYYYQRRYHGQTFLIERPEDFSPRWMRFVDEPPEDWVAKIKKITRVSDVKELMRAPTDPNAPFAMSQLQERDRQSATMNYSNGRVVQRRPS